MGWLDDLGKILSNPVQAITNPGSVVETVKGGDLNPMNSPLVKGSADAYKIAHGGQANMDPLLGSFFTGKGLPWGPGDNQLDPTKGSLFTGKGLPWGRPEERQTWMGGYEGNFTPEGKNKTKGGPDLERTVSTEYGGVGPGIPRLKPVYGTSSPDVLTPQVFSPRSALALEERLRSELRKQLDPNVEFNFNLERQNAPSFRAKGV